jgi:hypothetical protein
MSFTRSTKLNVDLIKDLPVKMKEELIVLNDVIPDGIMASLYVNNPSYKKKRHDFINHHPDLLDKMLIVRNQRRNLDDVDDRIMFETDNEIKFIKDYPQFKPLIESIIYMNGVGDIVKTVPIDQYLAEN